MDHATVDDKSWARKRHNHSRTVREGHVQLLDAATENMYERDHSL